MKRSFLLMLFILQVFSYSYAQSPERLFYSSMRPEGWDIYIVKDGVHRQFTNDPSLDYDAVLSPDGKWVVFTSERDGTPKLFIKPVEGNEPAKLLINSQSMQDQVSISPDGKWLTFVSTHNGDADIYKLPFLPDSVISVEAAVNLTNNPSGDFRPSFSPDGQKIVFSSDRNHKLKPHHQFSFAVHRTGDVFIMNNDGSEVKRLTDSEAWDGSPVFSPDGQHVFFYSERTGEAKIYKMNEDGSDEQIINTEGPKTISPVIFNEGILCTSWMQDNSIFNLSLVNLNSGAVTPFIESEIDMLNPHASKGGLIVFHGGPKPSQMDNNKGGFNGNLLVKSGDGYFDIEGTPVQTYGVRRAFAAPANPANTTMVIEHFQMDNVLSDIRYPAFGAAFVLLLIIILALSGIILAIVRRKKVKFWRYLLFTLGSILVFVLSFGSFFYFLIIDGMPLTSVSLNLTFVGVGLLLLTWYSFRVWKNRKSKDVPQFRVAKLMTFTLGLATFFVFYSAAFNFWFFDVRYDFYEVNYVTNEVKHLFKIEPELNINPANRQVLDMKYKPDQTGFILSLGRFGSDPDQQGDIYEYNFESKEVKKLTSSDHNDGFGGYSGDMKHLIYRSGQNGNMDLYLKSGEKIVQLTNTPAKENFPVISSQGDKIIYCTDESEVKRENKVKTMDIYLLRKLTTGWSDPIRITTNLTLEAHPHFSPNGEWITYTTEEFGIMDEQPLVQHYIFAPQMYGEIVAQRLNDGKKVRLTHNKWEEGAPLWEKPLSSELELNTPDIISKR